MKYVKPEKFVKMKRTPVLLFVAGFLMTAIAFATAIAGSKIGGTALDAAHIIVWALVALTGLTFASAVHLDVEDRANAQ